MADGRAGRQQPQRNKGAKKMAGDEHLCNIRRDKGPQQADAPRHHDWEGNRAVFPRRLAIHRCVGVEKFPYKNLEDSSQA